VPEDYPHTMMGADFPQYIDALIMRPQDTLLLVLKGNVDAERVQQLNDVLKQRAPVASVIVMTDVQAVVIRGADEVEVLS